MPPTKRPTKQSTSAIIGAKRIGWVQGAITQQTVGAIVNAANNALLVDGGMARLRARNGWQMRQLGCV